MFLKNSNPLLSAFKEKERTMIEGLSLKEIWGPSNGRDISSLTVIGPFTAMRDQQAVKEEDCLSHIQCFPYNKEAGCEVSPRDIHFPFFVMIGPV